MSSPTADRVDFFVSYNGRDVRWAKWLASQLESEGYTTVFQAADWGAGSNFVAEMHRGVERADRLILLASEAYLNSRWTEEEWTAYYYRDRDKILPVRIEDVRMPGLLGPLVRVDVFGIEEEVARERVLAAVRRSDVRQLAAPFPGTLTVAPFPTSMFSGSSAPPRDPDFRGRGQELDAVAATLEANRRVVLTGAAGVGKTAIAAEHLHRHASQGSFAWWISGHEPELVVKDLALAAASLGLPAALQPDERGAADASLAWLASNKDWLVVVDDVRDEKAIAALRALSSGSIIFTTTNAGWSGEESAIEVGPWSREDSVAYLAARVTSVANPDLADALGDLPLALAQARSYIAATGDSAEHYLDLLNTRVRELLDRGGTGHHSTTVVASVDLALAILAEDALSLAQILSTFAPDELALDFFRKDSLADDVLPGRLGDELGMEDALAELRRVGLIQRTGPFVAMHQLVQRLIFETITESERPLVVARGAVVLGEATPRWTSRVENWDQCARLLPHVLSIVAHLDKYGLAAPSSWLLNRMGVYVEARGDAALSEELLERAVVQAELAGDRVALGSALTNLANAVAAQGDLDRAIELANRSLDEKRAGGAGPLITARSVGALGSLLRQQGRFGEALALHREALALLEEDPTSEVQELVEERCDVAACLCELGMYEDAVEVLSKALSELEASDGPSTQQVGETHAALATALAAAGAPGSAIEHQQKALEVLQELLGPEHPDVAPVLSSLGMILRRVGRVEEARTALERAVAIIESGQGSAYPAFGCCLGNLGLILMDAGDVARAIEVHERSLSILHRTLGDSNYSVITQRALLATAFHRAGRSQDARKMYSGAIDGLMSVPFVPLHNGVVAGYVELLRAESDQNEQLGLVKRLIDYAAEAPESRRGYLYAWVAGVAMLLNDIEAAQMCMQRQGANPVVVMGNLPAPEAFEA